jgi:hypothetical protein
VQILVGGNCLKFHHPCQCKLLTFQFSSLAVAANTITYRFDTITFYAYVKFIPRDTRSCLQVPLRPAGTNVLRGSCACMCTCWRNADVENYLPVIDHTKWLKKIHLKWTIFLYRLILTTAPRTGRTRYPTQLKTGLQAWQKNKPNCHLTGTHRLAQCASEWK